MYRKERVEHIYAGITNNVLEEMQYTYNYICNYL